MKCIAIFWENKSKKTHAIFFVTCARNFCTPMAYNIDGLVDNTFLEVAKLKNIFESKIKFKLVIEKLS